MPLSSNNFEIVGSDRFLKFSNQLNPKIEKMSPSLSSVPSYCLVMVTKVRQTTFNNAKLREKRAEWERQSSRKTGSRKAKFSVQQCIKNRGLLPFTDPLWEWLIFMADFCVLYKKYNYQKLASFCLSILLAKALYTMRLVKLKLHGPFISPASFRVLCCPSQRRPPHTTHASQNLVLLTEVELVHDIPGYLVQGGKKITLKTNGTFQKVKHHKNQTPS